MRNRMRNKHQNQLTKYLRKANKVLEDDPLWRGRFYAMQRQTTWIEFVDDSGGLLYAQIRVCDKLTGYYKDYMFEYAPWMMSLNWKFYMEILNTYIVNDLDAWRISDPRKDTTDYKSMPKLMNDTRENNWFLGYEEWKKQNESI